MLTIGMLDILEGETATIIDFVQHSRCVQLLIWVHGDSHSCIAAPNLWIFTVTMALARLSIIGVPTIVTPFVKGLDCDQPTFCRMSH